MTPLRVLMLSKACVVGIYQRKLEYIAAAGDIDLRVLVPPSWRDERGEQALERAYTTGYSLRAIPIWRNGDFHLHRYPTLAREMAAFAPQVVHIDEEPYNLATWEALMLAKRHKARALFFSWQNLLRRYPPPFAWGERYVLTQADYALFGTENVARVWQAKGYQRPYAVVPQFGTDAELFRPQARPARPFTVGYVGRLVEEKGVAVLLAALAQLGGAWRARFIGGGPWRAQLEAQAAALHVAEQVEFVGQVASTAMPDVYASIDALVLPSLTRPNWKEQFGRVLIEAMSSGVPVIGSDSGDIPTVIGDAGAITPEGDAGALAAALRALRDDPAQYAQRAAAGRARVLAHFTHQHIAAQTLATYRALA